MNRCPARELLEEGDPSVAAHVAGCSRCSARASYLQQEKDAVRKWAAQDSAPTAHLWSGVQSRIRAQRRRRWIYGSIGAAAAAAALAVTVAYPRPMELDDSPSAELAIDGAETQYQHAAEVLEQQVTARAHTPEQRRAIVQARASLQHARSIGSADTAGRVHVLEGYAVYLRSLRRALRDDQ